MIRSSTLRRLAELHDPSDGGFWSQLERLNAPLIEDCGNPVKRLVTFVYRERRADNVALLCSINRQDFAFNQLQRYGESDLWHLSMELDADLRTRYLFSPNDSLVPLTDDDVLSTRSPMVCVDPLNPKTFTLLAFEDDPADNDTIYSVLELPRAPSLSHSQRRRRTPRGTTNKHRFRSDLLGNERSIWIYEPHDTYAGQERDLLIVFDGWNYTTVIPTPTILDNLTNERRIKPTVALFIEHDTSEARQRELPCNEQFAEFLAREIVPWSTELGVSAHSSATTLAGSSFGGLAACFAALMFPELIGNVIAQSCSAMRDDNRIIREFVAQPRQEIRIYLDVGTQEYSHTTGQFTTETMREFRDALAGKGYDVVYNEFNGGHDYNCWAASICDGLTAFPRSETPPATAG